MRLILGRTAWPWLVCGVMTLAIAMATLAFPDHSWAGWRPATCMPSDCFCEAIRGGLVAQPINTYSNLAFVLVGFWIAGSAGHARERDMNPMLHQRAYPLTFGVATVIIGLGSLFYHASLAFVGQWFDVMGMYLLGSFLVLYNIARLRPVRGDVFVLTYAGANIALGILLVVTPEIRRQLFTGLVVATLVLEVFIWRMRRPRIRYSYLLSAVACFAIGYVIWILDNARLFCAPEGLLQGHALWHVLSAAAAGLMYLYYRSERAW